LNVADISWVRYMTSARLPTPWGVFQIHGFEDIREEKEHLALSIGPLDQVEAPLVRIHSECLTGDALFSLRCDCGSQIKAAMQTIAEEGCGLVIYMRQEGRGIGLINKIKAYELQDQGSDTVEANRQLGFEDDERDYGPCGVILRHLGVERLRLMTNNPAKLAAVKRLGIEVVQRLPLHTGLNPHNEKYLLTKASKLGHLFS